MDPKTGFHLGANQLGYQKTGRQNDSLSYINGINDPSVRGGLYLIVILFTDYAMRRNFSSIRERINISTPQSVFVTEYRQFKSLFESRKGHGVYDIGGIFGYGACKRTKFVEC